MTASSATRSLPLWKFCTMHEWPLSGMRTQHPNHVSKVRNGPSVRLCKDHYLRIAALDDGCSNDVLVTWVVNGCFSQSQPKIAHPQRMAALRPTRRNQMSALGWLPPSGAVGIPEDAGYSSKFERCAAVRRLRAQLDRCRMVHQCRLSVGGQKRAKTGLVLPGVCGRAKPLICMKADLMDGNDRFW